MAKLGDLNSGFTSGFTSPMAFKTQRLTFHWSLQWPLATWSLVWVALYQVLLRTMMPNGFGADCRVLTHSNKQHRVLLHWQKRGKHMRQDFAASFYLFTEGVKFLKIIVSLPLRSPQLKYKNLKCELGKYSLWESIAEGTEHSFVVRRKQNCVYN